MLMILRSYLESINDIQFIELFRFETEQLKGAIKSSIIPFMKKLCTLCDSNSQILKEVTLSALNFVSNLYNKIFRTRILQTSVFEDSSLTVFASIFQCIKVTINGQIMGIVLTLKSWSELLRYLLFWCPYRLVFWCLKIWFQRIEIMVAITQMKKWGSGVGMNFKMLLVLFMEITSRRLEKLSLLTSLDLMKQGMMLEDSLKNCWHVYLSKIWLMQSCFWS